MLFTRSFLRLRRAVSVHGRRVVWCAVVLVLAVIGGLVSGGPPSTAGAWASGGARAEGVSGGTPGGAEAGAAELAEAAGAEAVRATGPAGGDAGPAGGPGPERAAGEVPRAAGPAGAAGVAAARWVWPTGSRVVVRPWEAPEHDYAAGHRGIDVRAPLGTVALAVADGTVTFAGPVAGRGVVTIDHGDGLRSTLDSVTATVTTGDTITQGDAVGRVAVGHCPASDPCLHLGARIDDRYVDPTPYLPPAAWPVLLPESAWTG